MLAPAIAARVELDFARQGALLVAGIQLHGMASGGVTLNVPRTKATVQQNGFVHGGILAMAMDAACGMAVMTLCDHDLAVLTISYSVDFLRPADGNLFVVSGTVDRLGKSVAFTSATARDQLGDEPVARLTATMALKRLG